MFFHKDVFIALALLYKSKISFGWFMPFGIQFTDANWALKFFLQNWTTAWVFDLLKKREFCPQCHKQVISSFLVIKVTNFHSELLNSPQ